MVTALLDPLLGLVLVGGLAVMLLRRLRWILVLVAVLVFAHLATQAVTSTDTSRSDPPSVRYVADSGVFLDRGQDPSCRASIDLRYLDDPAAGMPK